MKFELPNLPYSINSLDPAITEQTMNYHYGKHLQTYIDNLNALISNTPFENKTLEQIVLTSEGAIYNNAAQTWNHIFYFNTLAPKSGGEPNGKLKEAINKKWGNFENFKKEMSNATVSIFGSGWGWLSCNKAGELVITKSSNAGCPLTESLIPLLTIDVWEHAYYLSHQNRRAEYVNEIWDIINWKKIEERYSF